MEELDRVEECRIAELAHEREMFALKTRATIAAIPAAIACVYFLVWLVGGMTGHPPPPLDKFFAGLISAVFGAAITQLGVSYVESKRQQRVARKRKN
jgi:hypothetical protein